MAHGHFRTHGELEDKVSNKLVDKNILLAIIFLSGIVNLPQRPKMTCCRTIIFMLTSELNVKSLMFTIFWPAFINSNKPAFIIMRALRGPTLQSKVGREFAPCGGNNKINY